LTNSPGSLRHVVLGIFAHDEAEGIAAMISGLAGQDILGDPALSVRILLLANGCRDDTADRARSASAGTALEDVFEVVEGGKSRTWNAFAHDLAGPEAEVLVFCDTDIAFPDPTTLRRLVGFLTDYPDLVAVSSRPVKNITHTPPASLSLSDKLTSAAGGTLNDWRRSICGQLYAMRAEAARGFHLPIGLPVEDGFVRAMITTNVLSEEPKYTKIDGSDDIFHIYRSERGIRSLLNHSTRIVIGSAMNAVLFGHLRSSAVDDPRAELSLAANDPGWLDRRMSDTLPTARYGYVPWHFLTKRISRFPQQKSARKRLILLAGFGFDAIVWVMAQLRMARGAGAGYW